MATVNLFQNEAIGTFWIVELFLYTPRSIIDDNAVVLRHLTKSYASEELYTYNLLYG